MRVFHARLVGKYSGRLCSLLLAIASGTTIPPSKPQLLNLLALQPQKQCFWELWVFLAISSNVWESPMTKLSLSYLQGKTARKTSQEISQLAAGLGFRLHEPRQTSRHYARAAPGLESGFPTHHQLPVKVS